MAYRVIYACAPIVPGLTEPGFTGCVSCMAEVHDDHVWQPGPHPWYNMQPRQAGVAPCSPGRQKSVC